MYHHHQQQQQQQQQPPQGPQGFNTGPRPQTQPPVRPTGDMMPPVGGFQFPRPTQLPDELESALSIRGSRDMDHRLIEHLNRLKQHQSQASAPAQHGNYNTNLCDSQPKQQSVDWSGYEPPGKLFAQHQGGHSGTGLPNWNPAMGDSSVPPPPRAEGGRGFYTPESAGTILASFGLSNEDLEALSHYPDDQLTPDTLPFILRDLQIHKKPKASRSPEVPSLLTVTQTEGRVIDYGHASQAKDDNGPPKPFKKEPISSERTVKMYPTPTPKLDAGVGRQVRLEPAEPIKHGDRDYRRRSSEHQTSRSPPRDFSAAAKPRHQDRDYRLEQPKPRASAEKRSAERNVPKQHPPPTVKAPRAGLKAPSKKLPTPTMMSDFSGVPPKVFPHTCSLCDMQCDQEQEWIGHLGTVNHTAACRHLRTKFPDWKPKLPSRDYGKRPSASGRTASRSSSWSPPPHPEKHRGPSYKPRGKAYTPHHASRHHPYHTKDVDARFDRPHSRGGASLRRASFRDYLEKKELAGGSRSFLKRPHLDKRYSNLKGDATKKTPLSKAKSGPKPGQGSSKQGEEGPPAKKKKLPTNPVCQGPDCLVYLTEIPKEATELEVINLAGSFGPINNVLLMPSPEDDGGRGQQASVCMQKPEDAQTFANAPNLLIRDRVITATVATCFHKEQSSDADGSMRAEGGSTNYSSPKPKGVVIVEDLPDSGCTEEHLTALAEPFGYPDDIIVAKQIGKAILIMPDVATAREMVKVLSFSPASVNEQKVTVSNVYRNIGIHTPVALYNLLMHGVDGAAKTQVVSWHVLIVVSNVPQTQSSAAIVHKLVSRIGTVFNTLAVKNTVICEMATPPLAVEVNRHYLKFPCMIQNNPLIFTRKPDPRTPVKVIPAFLDTEKNVPEDKETSTPTEPVPPETTANPEPKQEVQPVEIKTEQTDAAEVMTMKENTIEETSAIPLPSTTPIVLKEEPEEPSAEDVVKVEVDEVKVTEEAAERSQSGDANPTEHGEQKQSVEETKPAAANEGETVTQDTPTEANVSKTASTEGETPVKASKPSAPSGKKQTPQEKTRDPVKNSHHNSSSSSSREEERRRRAERERREKESRDRERRERERSRKDRDHDDRSKREYERERRWEDMKREEMKREEMKREWRREWERREGRKKPYIEEEHRRSDGSRRSYHRDRDERHKSSSERRTDEDDFPFNLSDFVTVDEVGEVGEVGDIDTEAPNPDEPTETEAEPEPGSEPGLELGSEPGPETQTEESQETELTQTVPQKTEEKDVSMEEVSAEEKIDAETEEKPQETEETHDTAVTDVEMGEEEQPAEGAVSEITEELCPNEEEKSETNQEETPNAPTENTTEFTATIPEVKEEVAMTETSQKEEEEEEKKQENDTSSAPPAEPELSENGEKDATENTPKDKTLAPFDPNCSVGLEYLMPMTGFFCKVCTRFFTGAKDAQISHSKTFKHYENLQKFLKSSSVSADEPGST